MTLEAYLFLLLVMVAFCLTAGLLMDMCRVYILYQLELQIKMVDRLTTMNYVPLK